MSGYLFPAALFFPLNLDISHKLFSCMYQNQNIGLRIEQRKEVFGYKISLEGTRLLK